MPQRSDIITGLDIGSTSIRLAIGEFLEGQQPGVHIIGVSDSSSNGITRGVITSMEDAVSSITACLDKAERMVGVPIEKVWVGISGSHIISQESRGVIAVSKPSGEITESDIERAIEAARTVATPPNYEILHVIPKSFTVDGQSGIRDPRGMTGIRLEVDSQIIQGLSSQIKNITKAIYRTHLEIEDLVMSILATSEAVLTPRQKQLGCVVINIGGSTTSLAVFEEGDVLHTAILPIGSDHITSDIAIGLRVNIDIAEKIKLEYGSAFSKNISKRDEINVGEFGGTESTYVSRRYIAEIIEARVEEIFSRIDAELKKIDRSGMLPAGAILTGSGSKLADMVEVAKTCLRLPASLGYPIGVSSAIDKMNDPSYSTAVGLVLWGLQLNNSKNAPLNGFFSGIGLDGISRNIKRLFGNLMRKR